MSLLDEAIGYAERGWPIFPCKPSKEPYTRNGVLNATTDIKQIEDWWKEYPDANIGLDVGGAGMVALDLDDGHSLQEIEAALGLQPQTGLISRTPSGGEHWFFSLLDEDDVIAASQSKVAPHVDVRSFHSYVILPPSSTAKGKYEWISEDQATPRPEEIKTLSNAGRRSRTDDWDHWIIEPDLPENVDAAIDWLEDKAKIAVEGQGGDHTAYATAAMCRSFGLSRAMASEVIWEFWNPRCDPPWSNAEADHLERKIENAYEYPTSNPGNITPEYKRAKTRELLKNAKTIKSKDTGTTIEVAGFTIRSPLAIASLAPPEWLVQDFIPEQGSAVLVGEWGTYKTFIALDIALSVATGFCVDPVWQCRPGRVIYLAGEGHAGMQKRLEAWSQVHYSGQIIPEDNFLLVNPVPRASEEDYERLNALMEAAAGDDGAVLTVVDTVGRSMPGLDENTARDASLYSEMVQHIQQATGGAVLSIHHMGKSDKKTARGSSVFGADADTIVLTRKQGEFAVLEMDKQKDAEEWEKPVFLKMTKTTSGLAPSIPSKDDKPRVKIEDAKITDEIYVQVVKELLAKNPAGSYDTKTMADMVASDRRTGHGISHIRGRVLPRLRTEGDQPLLDWYDIHQKHWRHHKA